MPGRVAEADALPSAHPGLPEPARRVAVGELDTSSFEGGAHGLNCFRSRSQLTPQPLRLPRASTVTNQATLGRTGIAQGVIFACLSLFAMSQRRYIGALLPRSAGRQAAASLRLAIAMQANRVWRYPFFALSFTPPPFSSMNATPADSRHLGPGTQIGG
jgi:hypothetical protein